MKEFMESPRLEKIKEHYKAAFEMVRAKLRPTLSPDHPLPDLSTWPYLPTADEWQAIAWALADLLSLGFGPNNPMSMDKKVMVTEGLKFGVFNDARSAEIFNMKFGADFGLFAQEINGQPGMYLASIDATIDAVKAIWETKGHELAETFLEHPAKNIAYSSKPSQGPKWYIQVNTMPDHRLAGSIWSLGNIMGFHASESQDGIYYLTKTGPHIQKGVEAITDAIQAAAQGKEVDFFYGLHVLEAFKMVKKQAYGLPVSIEMGSKPDWGIIKMTNKTNRSAPSAVSYSEDMTKARNQGASMVLVTNFGPDAMRKVRYKCSDDILVRHVSTGGESGELWFISKPAINRMVAAIEQHVMFSEMPMEIDYSEHFSGLIPPIAMATFANIPALSGHNVTIDGRWLIIGREEAPQQATSESWRKTVIFAARTAIEQNSEYILPCSSDKIVNARVYIYQVFGKGRLSTSYEAGRLIITPIIK